MSTAAKALGISKRTFKKLNTKRKILLEEMVKGKTIVEASKTAGYAHSQSANNALNLMRANGELREALTNLGWSPKEFAEKHLVPMLNRKKTVFFAHNGKIVTEREIEDTQAQQNAGDAYLKIVGGYAPTQIDHSGTIVHQLSERERKEAEESLLRIKAFESQSESPLLAEVVEEQ
jgi:hypothetical protein